MSDKRPDERDIDEILASIDEMLSQKQPYSLEEDSRKDAVKEGIKASEDKLRLSSSVDMPELFEFDKVEIEDFLSLGIQDEPSAPTNKSTGNTKKEVKLEEAQESENNSVLKTDASQNTNDETNHLTAEDIDLTLGDIDIPDFLEIQDSKQPLNSSEDIAESSESRESNDVIVNHTPTENIEIEEPIQQDLVEETVLDEQVANNLQEDEEDEKDEKDESTKDDSGSTPRHRILLTEELLEPSAQEALPLWIEQAESEPLAAQKTTHTDDKRTPPQKEQPSATTSKKIKGSSNKIKDDTVFDLDEEIGVDTVYKLETLPVGLDNDLDNHTELVEVMMEEVLQQNDTQPQNTEVENELEKVFLSDDELQHMVQAVSADVTQQINDHLQTWLPALISVSIKNHIKDLNNNKT